MREFYEVFLGNESTGKVEIHRLGLYIRVICRCQTPYGQVYRLFAEVDDRRENLGVVVPEGDGCFLDRKIPAKRLGQGKIRFVLSSGSAPKRGQYTPILPEEPFWYIERHKAEFLSHRCCK